jgi:uncharacterized RDD family membrane protein YckC
MQTQDHTTPQTQPARETAGPGAEAPPEARAKAPLGKRFLAALIDGALTFVVGFLPVIGWLIGSAYWLLRDGLDLEFMDHRSLGKKVMGLRPVTLDGAPMDLVASAKRNWPLAIGGIASLLVAVPFIGWIVAIPVALVALGIGIIEIVLVFTDPRGRRIGDRTGNSQVVVVE